MTKKVSSKKVVKTKKLSPVEKKQEKAKKLIRDKILEGMGAKKWKPTDLIAAMEKGNATLYYTWISGNHNFTVNSLIELESALGVQLLTEGLSAARKKSARATKKRIKKQ